MAKHPSLQRPAHSVSILGIGLGERLDSRAKWKRLFSLLGGLETKLFRSFSSLILRLDCFVLEGWWR
jgi:hypothetical protein